MKNLFVIILIMCGWYVFGQENCPKCSKNVNLILFYNYSKEKDTIKVVMGIKPLKRYIKNGTLGIPLDKYGYYDIGSYGFIPDPRSDFFWKKGSGRGLGGSKGWCGRRYRITVYKNGKFAYKKYYSPRRLLCIEKGEIVIR